MKHQHVKCKPRHSSECPWAWPMLWELAGFGHWLHSTCSCLAKVPTWKQAGFYLWCMVITPFLVITRNVYPVLQWCGKSSHVNFLKTDVGKSKYYFSVPVHVTAEMQNELLSEGSAESLGNDIFFCSNQPYSSPLPLAGPKYENTRKGRFKILCSAMS